MNAVFKNSNEILIDHKISQVISEAVSENIIARMCHMSGGKWLRYDVALLEISEGGIVFNVNASPNCKLPTFQINQPVGISFQMNQAKYIFDSSITGYDTSDTSPEVRILIEMPDKIEKMPRRAYERQTVPENLHINVLFWHRGYIDNTCQVPKESYWQGQLTNLSAGGALINVSLSQSECFKPGQLVGIQFTPMFYQKPILVESQIIHIRQDSQRSALILGLEFLGLEVSIDGRSILHRLTEVVQEYAKMNKNSHNEEKEIV